MMLDKGQIKDWDGEPEDPAAQRASAPKRVDASAKPAVDAAASKIVQASEPAPDLVRAFGEARPTGETVHLSQEQEKARKRRGQWLALGLFAFVILIFVLTMTKMGAQILVRDL